MAKKPIELFPVSELAEKAGLQNWKLAAMCKAAGWTTDKQVSQSDFDTAVSNLESRKMGG
ncbi:hypothetical protein [Maridesulfovibrio bastinii]|uniref:hypothetical protein n=1 Tax=Maridesulfovibrio bastinii TaxID=47157 RepID=UPI00040940E3|nr:hypothetical protein [Maridesulfovibrio bastinii]